MLLGAIVGATGVGKTKFAISLAERLGAHIINGDSRQIYQGMRIGTAQPSLQELQQVPHHLVDFLAPTESYSAARFLQDVQTILATHPEHDYLLVGGTGLYIQVLQEGISPTPVVDPVLRTRLETIEARKGLSFLYRWALLRDPTLQASLRAGDRQRIHRALEIMLQTGMPFGQAMGPREGGLGNFPVVFLDRDRADLYRRIDARVLAMLDGGWLDEVRDLCTRVSVQSPGMQSLGYRQLVAVLQGERTLEQVTPEIQQETRHYAKRQLTWFRNKTPHHLVVAEKNGDFEEISAILKHFKKNA